MYSNNWKSLYVIQGYGNIMTKATTFSILQAKIDFGRVSDPIFEVPTT